MGSLGATGAGTVLVGAQAASASAAAITGIALLWVMSPRIQNASFRLTRKHYGGRLALAMTYDVQRVTTRPTRPISDPGSITSFAAERLFARRTRQWVD